MKVKVVIQVDGYEREFELSCGLGDKSFKWLAMAASQRLSLSSPNGALRCRDMFRGLTDHTQHLPFETYLENGDMPHPGTLISDCMRDGEKVFINLVGNQKISSITGTPHQTKWSTLAFSHSSSQFKIEQADPEDEDGTREVEVDGENPTVVKANSDFMRLILESQMINWKYINQQVTTVWNNTIQHAMPLLSEEDSKSIQFIFKNNWDTTLEMFQKFAPGEQMQLDQFTHFLVEASIFPARDLSVLGNRVYRRTCTAIARAKKLDSEPRSIDFTGFLVSLILSAQIRHHDTFERDVRVGNCNEALEELYNRSILPLAEKEVYLSILKETFCSEGMLHRLRRHHDDMFLVFQKYASRSRELSTRCRLDHMAEMLADALLVDPSKPYENMRIVHDLYEKIKRGSIFGRDPTTSIESKLHFEENVPSEEFEYPEFFEATVRAGFARSKLPPNSIAIPTSHPPTHQFGGVGPSRGQPSTITKILYDEDLSHLSLEESMIMGVTRAIETLNKETRK